MSTLSPNATLFRKMTVKHLTFQLANTSFEAGQKHWSDRVAELDLTPEEFEEAEREFATWLRDRLAY